MLINLFAGKWADSFCHKYCILWEGYQSDLDEDGEETCLSSYSEERLSRYDDELLKLIDLCTGSGDAGGEFSRFSKVTFRKKWECNSSSCLLYTSDAADD